MNSGNPPPPAPAPRWVWMQGEVLPAERAMVSVFDRCFLYGDGLFEGVRVCGGRLFAWEEHLVRMRRGAEFLRIQMPFDQEALRAGALELVSREGLAEAFVRIQLSRGVGRRGYSPRGADTPILVMTAHGMAPVDEAHSVGWKLATSSVRLPAGDALGNHKTASKLPQVYARMEADLAGADEALLLDTEGHVAEGASSNVFWIQGDGVCTPPLATGALAGVTRRWIVDQCAALGKPCVESRVVADALVASDGVFLTVSSLGVIPATHLDGQLLRRSARVETLRVALLRSMRGLPPRDGSPANA